MSDATKQCPYCSGEILADAPKCKHCLKMLASEQPTHDSESLPSDISLDFAPTIQSAGARPTLGGRYELIEELGRGGMGIVYKTKDTRLNTLVAIKLLSEQLGRDIRGIELLKREARTAMKLSHPNIVKLYNYEEHPEGRFLVMEYVEGRSLAELLAEKKRFDEEEVKKFGVSICKALEHAHSERIVHRDIKPSNIMIDEGGRLKVADFGIARVLKDARTRHTGEATSGTLLYMSPEQIMGQKTDARGDIYSLGITLYELLNGEPPFTTGDISMQHLRRRVAPIPHASEQMNLILQKCCAKKPEDRFRNTRYLRKALLGKYDFTESKPSRPVQTEKKRKSILKNYAVIGLFALSLLALSVSAIYYARNRTPEITIKPTAVVDTFSQLMLANELKDQGKWDEAYDAFTQLADRNTDNVDLQVAAVRFLDDHHLHKKLQWATPPFRLFAQKLRLYAERAILLDPSKGDMYLYAYRGGEYSGLDISDEVQRELKRNYEKTKQNFPNWEECYLRFAEGFSNLRLNQLALDVVTDWEKQLGESPGSMVQKSRALDGLGEKEKAYQLALNAYSKAPKNAWETQYLGTIEKARGNTARALELFQKAYEISPQEHLMEKIREISPQSAAKKIDDWTVTGRITHGSLPLSGETVELHSYKKGTEPGNFGTNPVVKTVKTDKNGNFRFSDVSPGDYCLGIWPKRQNAFKIVWSKAFPLDDSRRTIECPPFDIYYKGLLAPADKQTFKISTLRGQPAYFKWNPCKDGSRYWLLLRKDLYNKGEVLSAFHTQEKTSYAFRGTLNNKKKITAGSYGWDIGVYMKDNFWGANSEQRIVSFE